MNSWFHTATLAKLKTPIGSPDLREFHQLYTVDMTDFLLCFIFFRPTSPGVFLMGLAALRVPQQERGIIFRLMHLSSPDAHFAPFR